MASSDGSPVILFQVIKPKMIITANTPAGTTVQIISNLLSCGNQCAFLSGWYAYFHANPNNNAFVNKKTAITIHQLTAYNQSISAPISEAATGIKPEPYSIII